MYEAGLITTDRPVLDLSRADLRKPNLSDAEMSYVMTPASPPDRVGRIEDERLMSFQDVPRRIGAWIRKDLDEKGPSGVRGRDPRAVRTLP